MNVLDTAAPPPKCKRCNDAGWLDPIGPHADGSYSTTRPCPCGAYEGLEPL